MEGGRLLGVRVIACLAGVLSRLNSHDTESILTAISSLHRTSSRSSVHLEINVGGPPDQRPSFVWDLLRRARRPAYPANPHPVRTGVRQQPEEG